MSDICIKKTFDNPVLHTLRKKNESPNETNED